MSILEAIAALFVLVLMRLLLQPGEIPHVPFVGSLTDYFPDASFEDLVLGFAIVFGVFFLVRAGAFLGQQYALGRVAENTGLVLADRLFEGYLSMPYEFHLRRNSAELIRNAYDNVHQLVTGVFKPLATLFAESVLVLVMLIVLLVASPVATAVVTGLMLFTVAVTFAIVQPRLQRLGAERQDAAKSAMQHLQQGLGGLRDIKILGLEKGFASSFRRSRAVMSRAEYLQGTLAYLPRVSIETVFIGFVLGALVVATFQQSVETILATIGLFAYAGLRLQPSLQKIASGLNSLRYAQAAVEDLRDDMSHLDASVRSRNRLDTSPTRLPFRTAIAFEDVAFRYSPSGPNAVADVNLEVIRGESLGICGATGGGKTTFLDLLCGLLLPTSGRIHIDGQDLTKHVRSWQRNLGVVHQSSFLIDDTLRRNIAFGVDEGDIDEAALAQALTIAQLEDFIGQLPDGLDTMVGERGVRLSGGQRQRVTLARAVYRRPDVLLLDEGTSALDNVTESRVVERLRQRSGDVTLIMVAHRLSTIRHCDRIVFFDQGRISGVGTYDDLREASPGFRAFSIGSASGAVDAPG